MTDLPPYRHKPPRTAGGAPVVGWSGPAVPTSRTRCHCGRPVPFSSPCGCCCQECDDAKPIPARFDERYDPSPEPIDRSVQ